MSITNFSSLLPQALRQWLKRQYLWRTQRVLLAPGARLWQSTLEGHCAIHEGSRVRTSFIGRGTYIAADCRISGARVGRFCSIGMQVIIGGGDHPTDFVSTHPAFYSPARQAGFTFVSQSRFTEYPLIETDSRYQVIIGHDVWLGNRAMVMNGVRVGHGAIIGAGALLTHDAEPYGIYAGVPARLLRYRFDEPTRRALLASAWWEHDWDWLRTHAHLFPDVERFLRQVAA
ncbi:MAG: hypothetical protein Fur0018_20900 [Anaerolineales bacterium]